MKSIFLLMIFSVLNFQNVIPASEAMKYIGEEKWVSGVVKSYKISGNDKTLNYINLDYAYPDHIFTIVISDKELEKLNISIVKLIEKKIWVKGKIALYERDGKKTPQIYNPKAIKILD